MESITKDLKTLGIEPSNVVYTTDNFPKIFEIMTDLLKKGELYCDNTPADEMKKQRQNK